MWKGITLHKQVCWSLSSLLSLEREIKKEKRGNFNQEKHAHKHTYTFFIYIEAYLR